MRSKPELRRLVLAQRDALSQAERARRSAQAGANLCALPEFRQAGTVLCFVSFGGELDTRPLIEEALAAGKHVAVPRVVRETHDLVPHELRDPETDLTPGYYGILEPSPQQPVVSLDAIEAVIVPGVVWGEDGFRIGYGGGYYDRFLPRVPQAARLGLAFELQVLPEVPHGARDVPVEVLVTEAGVRRFTQVRHG
jgi:5-formyltetrahydrofolate cyclo-ligase